MEEKEQVDENYHRKVHPRKRATLLSKIFFCWTLPFFVKGFKRDITEDDLYGPLKAHESKFLGDKLEEAWRKECNIRKKPSLWRVLIKVFGKEFAIYGVILLIMELGLKILQPLLLGKLMEYYTPNQTTVSKDQAYFYASMIAGVSLINILISHSYTLGLQHLGMKMRIACCSLVYRKSLKLSKKAFASTTVGQMVNILSNDVNRFDMALIHLHNLWVGPVEAVVVVYLLYINVGWTALSGAAILVAFVPLQSYLGKKASVYRMRTALKTDQRVRLMNEIISGIEVIKMYTWEKPFAALVKRARKLEIHQIRAASYLRALNVSFMMFMNRTSIFLCVLAHVLTGNTLKAQYVYVVVAFYTVLRQAVTIFLPFGVTTLAETSISIFRIRQFLLHDEVNMITNEVNGTKKSDKIPVNWSLALEPLEKKLGNSLMNKAKNEVIMTDVCTKWVDSNPDYTLKDINISVSSGELIAIVGPVGSGKTTLLHTILKEIKILSGTLDVSGSISYASQEPWLFVSSIRQNILFGQEMDETKYRKVVKVCALERDFSLFPYGDRTIVGERGVMLSGGQKARINLARAIYKDADIYLLDDPLSAVDTHVGKQLFDDCVSGYLKDKCTILVTHQLQYLRTVNRIYLIENGSVESSGTYEVLQNSASDFVKLFSKEVEEEDEEAVEKVKKAKSVNKLNESDEKPEAVKEQRGTGQLDNEVYKKYLRAGGSWCVTFVVFSLFVLAQVGGSLTDYFLTFWVNLEQDRMTAEESGVKINNINEYDGQPFNLTKGEEQTNLYTFLNSTYCLYIYTSLIIYVIISTLMRSLCFFTFAMKASKNLHNRMFSKIVFASMWFFNNNPSGRILNRFAKDIGSIDEVLPITMADTLQIGLNVLTVTFVIASVQVWILIPSAVLFAIFYLYRIVFLATSRNLKRVEGTIHSIMGLSYVVSLTNPDRALFVAFVFAFVPNNSSVKLAWYLICSSERSKNIPHETYTIL